MPLPNMSHPKSMKTSMSKRQFCYHSLVLLILMLCFNLGLWQLDRAEEKRLMLDQISAGEQNPLPFATFYQQYLDAAKEVQESSGNGFKYQHIQFSGRYHADKSFILDNRTYQGKAGYQLLTLFEVDHTEPVWLLVNRGWIAAPRLRSERPQFETPNETVTLQVQLNIPEITQSYPPETQQWPIRLQQLDWSQLDTLSQRALLPYEFRLVDNQQSGVQQAQPASPRLTPEKHQGYALQWFSLFGVLLLFWAGPYWLARLKQTLLSAKS